MIALILFLVFFLRPQTALIGAFIAGLLEDLIAGPFGFHMVLYPFISFCGILVCDTLLTNKSFLAFFLLEISGFFFYYIIGISISSLQGFFYTYVSLGYLREILYGFLMQNVFILILYAVQYRRVKFSRAYLMFSGK